MAVKWQIEISNMIAKEPKKRNHLIIPPSLVKSAGKSGWYVKFYAYNTDEGKNKRVRIKVVGTTEKAKVKDADFIIKSINEAFESGAYISVINRTQEVKVIEKLTFEGAVNDFIKFKSVSLKTRSKETYNTWANTVLSFFEEQKLSKLFFNEITKKNVRDFFDFLLTERMLSNKSYNDYIGFLSMLYNHHLERENIDKNLVVGFIKRQKVISGKHVPYTLEQARKIRDYFNDLEDFKTSTFLEFCYYTLARPREELRNLKCGDIKEDTIYFTPENAKTTHTSYIVIPEPLEAIIQKFRLRDYPPEYYIFTSTKEFEPGPKPTNSKFFYLRLKKALKALNYVDKDYDLYSWKHTAVCHLFVSGVDIESIRQQCRHSDIVQTIQYLKDLGIIKNTEVKANFPRL